jgi:hypothetical protein
MNFEEWQKLTRLMLDFWALSERDKEIIFLMIDGLKYRGEK